MMRGIIDPDGLKSTSLIFVLTVTDVLKPTYILAPLFAITNSETLINIIYRKKCNCHVNVKSRSFLCEWILKKHLKN